MAYFTGKISKNSLVCKNAVALAYYGRCRLKHLVSPVQNFWLVIHMAGIIHSKFFFSHSISGITCLKFSVSSSNGWCHPFKNFSSAIQIASIAWLIFVQCRLNVYSIHLKFFMWPLERYFKLFYTDGTSVSHPFISHSLAVGLTDIHRVSFRVIHVGHKCRKTKQSFTVMRNILL